jgi:Fe-S cluster assembly iron-binding protein IscA
VLSITPTAEQAIEGLLQSPQVPDEGGVRIEAQGGGSDSAAGFQLSIVSGPAEGDQVIAEGTVFVEGRTAELLESSELDAEIDGDQVRFKLQHGMA